MVVVLQASVMAMVVMHYSPPTYSKKMAPMRVPSFLIMSAKNGCHIP